MVAAYRAPVTCMEAREGTLGGWCRSPLQQKRDIAAEDVIRRRESVSEVGIAEDPIDVDGFSSGRDFADTTLSSARPCATSVRTYLAAMSATLVERRLSGLTIRIDRGLCIATQNCIHIAGEVFDLDDSSVVAFRPDAREIERARLIDACASCPVEALSVFDERGEQIVP